MDHRDAVSGGTGVVGVLLTWLSFFLSHLVQVNLILQFFVLIGGLISTYFAVQFYRERTPK